MPSHNLISVGALEGNCAVVGACEGAGEIVPCIFHVSRTDNKIKDFKQMCEWYVGDQCIQQTQESILGKGVHEAGELSSACCLSEPNIVCFCRGKTSKIPCKDSNPIDKVMPSFW
jgi:hypothetical protein